MTSLDEYFHLPLTASIAESVQEAKYEPLRSASSYEAYKSTNPYSKSPSTSVLTSYK